MIYEEMTKSSWLIIVFMFSINILISAFTSVYYQRLFALTISIDVVLKSIIGGFFVFLIIAGISWNMSSSILGGIIGSWMISRKFL